MIFFKSNKAIFLLLLGIFILSRFIYLDIDLPEWGISYYQPIDELYYTTTAFDLFHHGVFHYSPYDFIPISMIDGEVNMESLFTFISLEIFGNNYYGLRGASVFSAILIFIILSYIINKNTNKVDRYQLIIFSMLYMITDYSFNLSARVAEPTIFRMFALIFILFLGKLYLDKVITKKLAFLFGFLSFSSFIFVYTTNAFIVLFLGISIFFISLKQSYKEAFNNSIYFLFGTILALIFFLIFFYWVYGENYFTVFLKVQEIFSARTLSSKVDIFNVMLSNGKIFFQTNMFMYNLSLLSIFIFTLPLYTFLTFTKRKNFDILIASALFALFLQSLYINDYYQRKLIILFPLVLIIILRVIMERRFLFNALDNHRLKIIFIMFINIFFFYILQALEVKYQISNIKFLYISNIILFVITGRFLFLHEVNKFLLNAIFGLTISILFIYIMNLYEYDFKVILFILTISCIAFYISLKSTSIYVNKQRYILLFIYTIQSLSVFLYYIFNIQKINIFFWNTNLVISIMSIVVFIYIITSKKLHTFSLAILLIGLSLTNIYLNYEYIYKNPKYTYKEIMIDIGEKVGDNDVGGRFVHGFRLYNDINPLFNTYHYTYYEEKEKFIEDTLQMKTDHNLTFILGYQDECKQEDYHLSVTNSSLCWIK